MKRTMGDTWWTEVRWRVSLQFLIWGTQIAPDGDAKAHLIDAQIAWGDECKRQWHLRYPALSQGE